MTISFIINLDPFYYSNGFPDYLTTFAA